MRFEPLQPAHLDELATVLRHPAVYEHIGGTVPSGEDFKRHLRRAIAGPREPSRDETWLNFLVRDADGAMAGRLEATVHHGLAEVAFLFGPRFWGRGLARAGLEWLHEELERSLGVTDCWATTVPANLRCQALLRRCGYVESRHPSGPLYSYAAGDSIFRRRSGS